MKGTRDQVIGVLDLKIVGEGQDWGVGNDRASKVACESNGL